MVVSISTGSPDSKKFQAKTSQYFFDTFNNLQYFLHKLYNSFFFFFVFAENIAYFLQSSVSASTNKKTKNKNKKEVHLDFKKCTVI